MYAAYTLFKDAGEIVLPSYKSAAFAQTLLTNIKKTRKESYDLIVKSKFDIHWRDLKPQKEISGFSGEKLVLSGLEDTSSFGFCCWDKNADQNQLGEERDYFIMYSVL